MNGISSEFSQYSLATEFNKLASGSKINSAADDAAGLAISEQLTAQINGYEQGTQNTSDMKNLVNTADSALSNISGGLNRVRELAIQSMNGLYTNSDRQILNYEVQQILEGIGQTVRQTQFNGQTLLDGTFSNKHTASSPDGSGMSVSIPDFSLEALGLKDFSLVGGFDLEDIDNALQTVSDVRSQLGATSNRMDFTVNSNQISELNLASSRSRFADTDMARTVTEMKKQQLLGDVRLMMQQRQQEDENKKISFLL